MHFQYRYERVREMIAQMGASNLKHTNEMAFLIVDDSHSMRRIIKRTIRDMGCKAVFEADSGKEAMKILADAVVDFIVCDWNMPGMSGIELLQYVRASNVLKDMPFLMVSAESKTENIVEAIRNGVSNYLPKPFNAEMLRKKIEVILDARKAPGT